MCFCWQLFFEWNMFLYNLSLFSGRSKYLALLFHNKIINEPWEGYFWIPFHQQQPVKKWIKLSCNTRVYQIQISHLLFLVSCFPTSQCPFSVSDSQIPAQLWSVISLILSCQWPDKTNETSGITRVCNRQCLSKRYSPNLAQGSKWNRDIHEKRKTGSVGGGILLRTVPSCQNKNLIPTRSLLF